MRRHVCLSLLTLLLGSGWAVGAPAGDSLDAREIVRRSDDLLRSLQSYARITMTITRPEWDRTLVMDAWTQGASNALIRTLSPRKEKGVTFLKRGREAWNYVPNIDRVIKIPPSMMLQSWLGSDFTNDDIVRADSLVVDYTHTIVEGADDDDSATWLIEAVPLPDAAVVWGKVVFRIRKSTFVADRIDYYDEDGALIKYGESSDVKSVEGHDVATRFVMHDVTRPGHQTDVHYADLTFQPDLQPDTFSLRNLRR